MILNENSVFKKGQKIFQANPHAGGIIEEFYVDDPTIKIKECSSKYKYITCQKYRKIPVRKMHCDGETYTEHFEQKMSIHEVFLPIDIFIMMFSTRNEAISHIEKFLSDPLFVYYDKERLKMLEEDNGRFGCDFSRMDAINKMKDNLIKKHTEQQG